MDADDFKFLIGLFLGSYGLGVTLGYLIGVFKIGAKISTNR